MSNESDRAVTVLTAEVERLRRCATQEANAVAADLREAVTLIFTRAGAREEARRKKLEWEQIIPVCRAAKEKFDKLNAEAEEANELVLESHRLVDQAESHLNQARDAKPAPWPTPQELSNWKTVCKKLEDSLETARAQCRAANQRRGELTAELLRARDEFTSLVFRERNLRPQEAKPNYRGSELAGVR
jgi:chromosome segregation ATPase